MWTWVWDSFMVILVASIRLRKVCCQQTQSPCLHPASFVESLCSQKKCKPVCEKIMGTTATQLKVSHLRREGDTLLNLHLLHPPSTITNWPCFTCFILLSVETYLTNAPHILASYWYHQYFFGVRINTIPPPSHTSGRPGSQNITQRSYGISNSA